MLNAPLIACALVPLMDLLNVPLVTGASMLHMYLLNVPLVISALVLLMDLLNVPLVTGAFVSLRFFGAHSGFLRHFFLLMSFSLLLAFVASMFLWLCFVVPILLLLAAAHCCLCANHTFGGTGSAKRRGLAQEVRGSCSKAGHTV